MHEPHVHVMGPEEFAAKGRILPAHGQVPGQRQAKRRGAERQPGAPARSGGTPVEQLISQQRNHHQDQGDRALGQEPQATGGGGQQPPSSSEPDAVQCLLSQGERGRHPQGEQPVHGDHACLMHESRGQAQHQRPGQARAQAERARSPPEGDQDRCQGSGARNDAGRPILHAADRVAAHDEPEEQGRFFVIGRPVTERHEPVAAQEHLPRHLGIDGVFRLEQRRLEAGKEQQAGDDEQHDDGNRFGPGWLLAGWQRARGKGTSRPPPGEPAEQSSRVDPGGALAAHGLRSWSKGYERSRGNR